METNDIAALLTAIGAGGIIGELIRQLIAWARGLHRKRHAEVTRTNRLRRIIRTLEQYAHRLYRLLLDTGADPDDIPPWPEYTIDPDPED